MYPSVRSIPKGPENPSPSSESNGHLSRNLFALGITSFFTDISSEMVLSVVPLFLTTNIALSLFGFGIFDSVFQAASTFFRIWGGSRADQHQNHKATAATGYTISAATRLGLVLTTVTAIPAIPFLIIDRMGKGLRTAPRDALISLSTPADRVASAFGVHRAMDTAGALLGPLIAALILATAPGAFDAVFVVSAIAAVIGVAAIWLFAEEKAKRDASLPNRPKLREQWSAVWAAPGIKPLLLAAGFLSLASISDAFIYLVLQRNIDLGARFFPLLFAGTAVVYLVLAVPVGRLADRIGHAKVFVAGQVLLLAVYGVLGFGPSATVVTIVVPALLGMYYAATDGVLVSMASRLLPTGVRGSGIAIVSTVVTMGRVVAAFTFGLLIVAGGRTIALAVFGAVLLVAIVAAVPQLRRSEQLGMVQ